MGTKVSIKLLGVLHGVSGRSRISLKLEEPTVRKMMQKLADSLPKEAKKLLVDSEVNDYPQPNMLIIINGKEISALKGLETEIREDDEVVVIPVSHGG
jgi:molybdopterin converting factor small subunit